MLAYGEVIAYGVRRPIYDVPDVGTHGAQVNMNILLRGPVSYYTGERDICSGLNSEKPRPFYALVGVGPGNLTVPAL